MRPCGGPLSSRRKEGDAGMGTDGSVLRGPVVCVFTDTEGRGVVPGGWRAGSGPRVAVVQEVQTFCLGCWKVPEMDGGDGGTAQ